MKKLISALLSSSMLLSVSVPYASAFEQSQPHILSVSTQTLSSDITVKQIIFEENCARKNSKTATFKEEYYDDNTLIGVIAIRGTFEYNGKTSRVISKTVSSKQTYHGWTYQQDSFTSTGSSIKLNAQLKKSSYNPAHITLVLSCDKDGNIS